LRHPHNVTQIAIDLGVTRFALQRHRDNHLVRKAAAVEALERLEDWDEVPERAAPSKSLDPQTSFLTSYSASGDLQAALKAAGMTRVEFRRLQEHDEGFLQRFHQAEVEAIENLEAEARIRAVAGSKLVRRVYRHGLLYEEIHEWRPSDAVLTKLLQAAKPEKYGDKVTITQTTVVKAVDADAWNAV
jgi:hypothetical protein